MQYDPIKDKLSNVIGIFPLLRKVLFFALDLLLLRQKYVKQSIRKYFSKNSAFRFYDAGAGFCQYADFALSQYPKAIVHAVDLKTTYLESYDNALSPDFASRFSFTQADLQTYTPRQKYDLVCAIDILEHIEDDMSTLQNFHTAMNPNAKLIISTPSDLDEAARFTSEHVRPGYNKIELEEKLIQCGFKILQSYYSYGFWGALAWKLLMKFPLSSLSRSKVTLVFLPFYYLMIYPAAAVMMYLDISRTNHSGNGIIVIATK